MLVGTVNSCPPHYTDEETEAPKPGSPASFEPGFEARQSDSRVWSIDLCTPVHLSHRDILSVQLWSKGRDRLGDLQILLFFNNLI